MKRIIITILSDLLFVAAYAVQTTYTFYNAQWASRVGTVIVSGTDGWISDHDGASYSEGKETPQGYMYAGVQVTSKEAYKNAGATSVLSFTEIRSIVLNYRTNASKGKGTIYIKIGNEEPISVPIEQPEKGKGEILRDIEIPLTNTPSGHIQFYIDCTENSIYLNSITIKAKNGSPNIVGLTTDMFQLVSDMSQLGDSEEVIIGVADPAQPYIMGLYDLYYSRNNIHALKATYSADRQTVNPQEEAVYTLKRLSDSTYTLQDIDGYYLVASGGNPNHGDNNYLTIWDSPESRNYGSYGLWSLSINTLAEAEITNQGVSRSNKLQFNQNGNTPIFSCYASWSQTKPALYRKVTVDATEPYIKPIYCHLGTLLLDDNTLLTGTKTIEVNAVNLSKDIQATISQGQHFSIDKTMLDRDGDILSIAYSFSQVGEYHDTIRLQSAETSAEILLTAIVSAPMTISEATQLEDLTQCYLRPVVVTKKYDKYIFVRDDTGSMLLFDGQNLYGKDLKNGDLLSGVVGRYKNYYGNPEIVLTAAFDRKTNQPQASPDILSTKPDSDDVCRFVRLEGVQYQNDLTLSIASETLSIYDLFKVQSKTTINTQSKYNIEGIVYYYDGVVFCPSLIETVPTTATETLEELSLQWQGKTLSNPQHLSLCLYSVDGRLLSTTTDDIDITDLPAGLYIIEANTKSIIITR